MADYTPRTPTERAYFEHLWSVANEDGSEALGGAAAVQFLGRSSVNTGMLRQIWAMCTPGAAISKEQFFSVLRLICMFQNGDFPITREQMAKSVNENFPLPVFSGISLPQAPPPQAPVPPPAGGPGLGALPPPAAYAMTPEEKLRYDNLFANYDSDHDGFLQGGEAVGIFNQSGLDIQVLRAIWNIADDDKDSKLSAAEFAVAFHIILCVSKKGLPVPPGLPAPLRAFLSNGGVVQADSGGPRKRPSLGAPAAAPAPAPAPAARLSVSDAFGSVEDGPPAPAHGGASSGALSGGDSDEVSHGVMDLTAASKKLLGTQNAALEVSERAVSSVRGLIQRLATERVSIAAATANAEADVQAQTAKLEAALEELNVLRAQCEELRRRHGEALANQSSVEQRLSQAAAERQALLSSIEDTRRTIAQLTNEKDVVHGELRDATAESAAEKERQSAIGRAAHHAKNEAAGLHGEIETLSKILMSLNEDKSSRGVELQRLRSQLAETQRGLADARSTASSEASQLAALTAENTRLQKEVDSLLSKVAAASNASAPPERVAIPAAVPEPSAAPQAAPAPIPKEEPLDVAPADAGFDNPFGSTETAPVDDGFGAPVSDGFGTGASDGFGFTADDGFGTAAAADGFGAADDGFGSAGFGAVDASASTAPDGFGDFGASAGDSAFGNPFEGDDGFGSAAASTTEAFGASDGFGSVAADGFGSVAADGFGSAAADGFGSVAADGFGSVAADGFGSVAADGFGSVAADGFGSVAADGFGSAAADGFGSSAADGFGSAAADGFGADAFGDSSTAATTGDGFGDDGFGGGGFGGAAAADDGFGASSGAAPADDGFGAAAGFGEEPAAAAPPPIKAAGGPPPLLSERPKHGASTWDVGATDSPAAGFGDSGFGDAAAAVSGGDGFGDAGFGDAPPAAAAFDDGFGSAPAVPAEDDGFGASGFGDGFGEAAGTGAADPFASSGTDFGW